MSDGSESLDATRAMGAALSPSPVTDAQTTLRIADRYEVRGLVGMGGMGTVYRVHDSALDVLVALKFVRRPDGDDGAFLARFRGEATLARRVSHVNVARTYDVGEHQGDRFITMEFIEGESLATVLGRSGALPVQRSIEVARQVCAGLAAAHAAGVLHLDLKPENVLIERGGRVVITDFGIARAVAPGSSAEARDIIGTVSYMAPEQAAGTALDARSDVYALGAVLFEMLTGAKAWSGNTFVEVTARKLLDPPPDPRIFRPELPESLGAVVRRCMAREPNDRFPDIEAVVRALTDALDGARDHVPDDRFEAPLRARALRVAPGPQMSATKVAVLPIANLGPREDDFVADELTDEAIDSLSMLGTLRVRPRRMVQGRDTSDLSALGKALDVDVVVEGTLRRNAENVRVDLRVLVVADGLQVWARKFQHPAGDLVGVSRAMSEALAEALVRSSEPSPPIRGPARVADSMFSDLYLRARRELRRTWAGTNDIGLAVELFRQALSRAPDDPAVLSGYAMARARRYNYAGGEPGEVGEIRALAERAIALAPHVGEPWQTLATLSYVTSEWPDAVRSLRRALHLAPGLLSAHESLAYIEVEVGRIDEGLFRLQNALSLDPSLSLARFEVARIAAFRGEWDRVYELIAPAPEGELSFRSIASARLDAWSRAPRLEVVSLEDSRTKPELFMARVLGEAARGVPVVREVDEMTRTHLARTPPRSRYRPAVWQLVAEAHSASGDFERAIDAVRHAVASELFDRSWMALCPLLEPLRTHAEWPALFDQVEARARVVRDALDEALEFGK